MSGMRLVVDAVGVRRGSAAIVIGNLLRGWTIAAPQDELIVLTDGEPQFTPPVKAVVRPIMSGEGRLARLRAQSVGVRRECRAVQADALLSAVTASAFLGARCPSGAIVYDVRHELRPAQFARGRRIARRVLYGWTFRRSDALLCISNRTRQDIIRRRPGLAGKTHATLLGADHAAEWRGVADPHRYVLAFGHFQNKNLDGVLRAWARAEITPGVVLRVCGLGQTGWAAAATQVRELGLEHRVELLGWLEDGDFESIFAGASAVMFPSDFEGFGLPAVEALLLGIPVVVSTDPALLEVTAGHAVIAEDDSPATLAAAIETALKRSPGEIAAGVAHARSFTWARMAEQVRAILVSAASR